VNLNEQVESIGVLVALIGIGGVSAAFDITTQRIPNRLTGILIVFGILFQSIRLFYYHDVILSIQILMGFIILLLAVFFLFHFRVWAAGDAKLFIAMIIVIPVRDVIFFFRFSLIAFAITFSLSFCYLMGDSLWNRIYQKEKHAVPFTFLESIPKRFYYSSMIWLVITYLNLSVLEIFPELPSIYFGLISVGVILLFKREWRQKIAEDRRAKWIILVLYIVILIAFPSRIWMYLKNWIIVFVIIVLKNFAENYNYRDLAIEKLKPGMVVSLNQTMLFTRSRVKGLPIHSFEDFRSRLSIEEVESINRWKGSKYGANQVEIVRFIPFAPFIACGMILAYILELM
jgi:Flp pilus assembly protein protease CpaA